MKFKKWVEAQGYRKIAVKLGLERQTVYAWISRVASPRASTMRELVHMGKGAFDYKDIVEDTMRGE